MRRVVGPSHAIRLLELELTTARTLFAAAASLPEPFRSDIVHTVGGEIPARVRTVVRCGRPDVATIMLRSEELLAGDISVAGVSWSDVLTPALAAMRDAVLHHDGSGYDIDGQQYRGSPT